MVDAQEQGELDLTAERTAVLRALSIEMKPRQIRKMMTEADPDKSGEVDFEEVRGLRPTRGDHTALLT